MRKKFILNLAIWHQNKEKVRYLLKAKKNSERKSELNDN
jgi:hypothetical protein